MGKVIVVGLGPGSVGQMTGDAVAALKSADLICGYTVYIELAKPVAPDTPVLSTPMTKEIDRCRAALAEAAAGKTVAMVCSGDAGVYGMSGLVYELSGEFPGVEVEVVCGVTAALSGGAVLGAPLVHDFCAISLSDRLTPWEKIERRLACAAEADFCIAIYNPSSKLRPGYLAKACDILLASGKQPQTVCGVVRNIGREGEECWTGTLAELCEHEVDMFSTVFIGNEDTRMLGDKMVTPRGYQGKPEWEK